MHEDLNAPPTPPDPESLKRGHEFRDMKLRGLIWFLVIFIIVGVLVHVIVWISFRGIAHMEVKNEPAPPPNAGERQAPPAPILQPTQQYHEKQPWQDLQEMHQREDAHLNNYAWVDQKAGIVQIPIDRAMELVVHRGLPTERPADGGQR